VPCFRDPRIEENSSDRAPENYARYFLTVYDIVKYARSQDILCQGRGSAANSVICYCLKITDVGPDVIDTLFERFISRERNEPPDIDVDFEHEKRDIVIEYIYRKYSEKRTALAASVVTYRGRSALREVAKAMGLSDDVRGALSGSIWGWSASEIGEREAKAGGLSGTDAVARHVIDRANDIMGFPRHLSQHVGGFVITRDRLDEIVPIVKTAMDERKMVEWDKDDLDAVKILKVDILALGMLTCLQRAFTLLTDHYPDARDDYGQPYVLATLPAEDIRVYDMICRADTLGVFQIRSRAQMSMLPRVKPPHSDRHRSGDRTARPIKATWSTYLRRRQGERPNIPSPGWREDLGKTLGVPCSGTGDVAIGREASGQAKPTNCAAPWPLQAHRHHRQLPPAHDRRHGRQGIHQGLRRALLQADRGLRRIRLSRKPCRLLRAARLCLMLVQDLLSRRVLRRDPEFAADGILPAGPARPRRARSWNRHTRRRRQFFRLGLHAGAMPLRSGPHPRPSCRDARCHQDKSCRPAWFPPDQGTFQRAHGPVRRTAGRRL
jgi:hypothetical protein